MSLHGGHTILKPGPPAAAGMDEQALGRAFGVLDRFVREARIPGAVALVARHGYVFGPYAYGYARLLPQRVPAQPNTLYDMASVTKVVCTTTLALQAIDRGLLRLDDRVDFFLPEFTSERPANEREDRLSVTIRHLLTHTSGLPAWKDLYTESTGPESIVAGICRTPLEAQAGTRVVYSCLGFILLGAIIERLFGASLAELASTQITGPLGMHETRYNPPATWRDRIAATELKRPASGVSNSVGGHDHDDPYLCGRVHDENARAMGGVSGNAGLFSTAADMAVFCQMLLNGGTYGGVRILSPAAVTLATQNHTAHLNESRGLGWVVKGHDAFSSAGDLLSPASFGHTGFTGTSVWIDPVRNLFIVLLTNRVHPTRENLAHIRLRPLFHNAVASAVL